MLETFFFTGRVLKGTLGTQRAVGHMGTRALEALGHSRCHSVHSPPPFLLGGGAEPPTKCSEGGLDTTLI